MKYRINKNNIRLLMEDSNATERLRQNFLNGTSAKDSANEEFKMGALNSGIVDAETKENLIKTNHKNEPLNNLNNNGNRLGDLNGDGILDKEDLIKKISLDKAFK